MEDRMAEVRWWTLLVWLGTRLGTPVVGKVRCLGKCRIVGMSKFGECWKVLLWLLLFRTYYVPGSVADVQQLHGVGAT